jgi:hypothetical protein
LTVSDLLLFVILSNHTLTHFGPTCCSIYLQQVQTLDLGKKKNVEYIASLFDPWIQKLDPGRPCVDCVFFDRASNVQLAGQLLATKYPQIHVQTCAAHLVLLFFSTSARSCGRCNSCWSIIVTSIVCLEAVQCIVRTPFFVTNPSNSTAIARLDCFAQQTLVRLGIAMPR